MGRIDDVMNVSGHRISTTEVESALVDHPAVAEAAVCGKLDEMTGQAIYAFVSLKGTATGSPEFADELRDHVAGKLGKFTRPKYVTFTQELPKTRSGKIMRRLLRDIAEGRTLGDTTTLADSSIVKELQERAKSRGHAGRIASSAGPRAAFIKKMREWQRLADAPTTELAIAFGAHERWAFGDAYRRYASLLYSAAYNVLGNGEEAQDCVSDAIARLWRSPRRLFARTRKPTQLPGRLCAQRSDFAAAATVAPHAAGGAASPRCR